MIEAPVLLKRRHVTEEVDRHGNVRLYFRQGHGPRVRIKEKPGSEEFDLRYHEVLRQAAAGELQSELQGAPKPYTLRWLAQKYTASLEFRALDSRTQYVRRRVLDQTYAEPIAPGAQETFGDLPLREITPKAVKILRDRKSHAPDSANTRLKAIRAVFKWALQPGNEIDGVNGNPSRDVPFLRPKKVGGIHTWTPEEIKQFERTHPLGTKARLALSLVMCTGARRSDVAVIGRQHVNNGWLKFKAFKGRNRAPVIVEIPLLQELQTVIDASPTGDLTFLVTKYGKPYSKQGLSQWFKEMCLEAGLPDCSIHGLRKAAAARAAERGATTQQLKAIFGWRTLQQPERYTRDAQNKELSKGATHLLSRSDGEQDSLTRNSQTAPFGKRGQKNK